MELGGDGDLYQHLSQLREAAQAVFGRINATQNLGPWIPPSHGTSAYLYCATQRAPKAEWFGWALLAEAPLLH